VSNLILAGLTGAPASGKSTALACFEEMGWYVLDADRICHELYDEDPIRAVFRGRWGESVVLSDDGRLSRKAIADIVFSNPVEMEWLNSFLHPLIRARAIEKESAEAAGRPVIFDVPLLFETGWEKDCRWTLSVWCKPRLQRERLASRGWTEDELRRRSALHWDSGRKLEHANFGLINTGSRQMLFEQCRQLDKYMRKELN